MIILKFTELYTLKDEFLYISIKMLRYETERKKNNISRNELFFSL
jgi:hypothetical protein